MKTFSNPIIIEYKTKTGTPQCLAEFLHLLCRKGTVFCVCVTLFYVDILLKISSSFDFVKQLFKNISTKLILKIEEISRAARNKGRTGKLLRFSFPFKKRKNYILNEKFNSDMVTIRALFLKIKLLPSKFSGRIWEISPTFFLLACSNTKCRIPLLTKLTTMKLKIDVFSVSMIFL